MDAQKDLGTIAIVHLDPLHSFLSSLSGHTDTPAAYGGPHASQSWSFHAASLQGWVTLDFGHVPECSQPMFAHCLQTGHSSWADVFRLHKEWGIQLCLLVPSPLQSEGQFPTHPWTW